MTNPDDLVVNMFPHRGDTPGNLGLTKREYFAIQCLQGILANPESIELGVSAEETAVERADNLIAELNKE